MSDLLLSRANASLVIGLLSPVLSLGVLVGILSSGIFGLPAALSSLTALSLAYWSLGRFSSHAEPGYRSTLAGFVAGAVGLFLALGTILTPFPTRHHRIPAEEASAVGSLRTLHSAIRAYAEENPNRGFPSTLKELSWEGRSKELAWAIDPTLASSRKGEYQFTYAPKVTQSPLRFDAYEIFADPIGPMNKVERHFFVDQTGTIRCAIGAQANAKSPPL
jgi:type IV pilus assembly protein PilA